VPASIQIEHSEGALRGWRNTLTTVATTQVGIIGAGPAGLVLSHLLGAAGIDSVIVESRSRAYVEQRVRAGVLEQGTVELLDGLGLAARVKRLGLVHRGILLGFAGRRHRIALSDLTGGRSITVYGQQELVKDLIAARLAAGGAIEFGAEDVRVEDLDTTHPRVLYRDAGGDARALSCDFVAGCDGFHGVCRPSIPAGALTVYQRNYPFAWLGILAAVAPSTQELIYARHDRGFALHSLRSPEVSRLYLQVDPDERLDHWSDERIWSELRVRLATTGDDWRLADGPILERSIALHHGFVVEPMQHGRLFLAGDAAHIVPPTGAKGLNLAVADVRVLARGVVAWYASGDTAGLDGYSARCLARVWRVQEFSSWMSTLLHRLPGTDAFDERLMQARLDWTCNSEAAARSLAENYVGLPFE
jgi:p-hydroxybenzoate 3-monooxygenase